MAGRVRTAGGLIAAGVLVVLAAGCSLKTHPVHGKVEFADGDVKTLAGCNVEFELNAEGKVRSYGEIRDDGTFEMQTNHEGRCYPGVPAGTHKVRLLLASELLDDVAEAPKHPDPDEAPNWEPPVKLRKAKKIESPVHRRYLDFATSNLTVTVPSAGGVSIQVSKK